MLDEIYWTGRRPRDFREACYFGLVCIGRALLGAVTTFLMCPICACLEKQSPGRIRAVLKAFLVGWVISSALAPLGFLFAWYHVLYQGLFRTKPIEEKKKM